MTFNKMLSQLTEDAHREGFVMVDGRIILAFIAKVEEMRKVLECIKDIALSSDKLALFDAGYVAEEALAELDKDIPDAG